MSSEKNLCVSEYVCFQTKAKHIKKTAEILKEEFKGDIPATVESLCSLPGVGPKMAHLCMQCAWGITSGIGTSHFFPFRSVCVVLTRDIILRRCRHSRSSYFKSIEIRPETYIHSRGNSQKLGVLAAC